VLVYYTLRDMSFANKQSTPFIYPYAWESSTSLFFNLICSGMKNELLDLRASEKKLNCYFGSVEKFNHNYFIKIKTFKCFTLLFNLSLFAW
jgi:hypothetical protein